MTERLPPIYVDIDDTLIRSFGSKRIPMRMTIEAVRRWADEGLPMYCWSSGGAAYAERSAREVGLHDCFVAFLPKPQVLLDDVALKDWGRLLEVHPTGASSMSKAELLAKVEELGW